MAKQHPSNNTRTKLWCDKIYKQQQTKTLSTFSRNKFDDDNFDMKEHFGCYIEDVTNEGRINSPRQWQLPKIEQFLPTILQMFQWEKWCSFIIWFGGAKTQIIKQYVLEKWFMVRTFVSLHHPFYSNRKILSLWHKHSVIIRWQFSQQIYHTIFQPQVFLQNFFDRFDITTRLNEYHKKADLMKSHFIHQQIPKFLGILSTYF